MSRLLKRPSGKRAAIESTTRKVEMRAGQIEVVGRVDERRDEPGQHQARPAGLRAR